ncbi:hypothetical protein Amal_03367 [Acetobacter malorum]|uniref:Uncharacterized protein n=1 Tax=Acetobacter malorum TaxID=178901 RepID=A0A177G7C5_9PROT|nr:hypothetical protein Amal_03367 [Acetobacter malorum]
MQQIYKTDRPFIGDGMKSDEGFFARVGFNVLENLVFIIDEAIAIFMRSVFDFRHGISPVCCGLRRENGVDRVAKANVARDG